MIYYDEAGKRHCVGKSAGEEVNLPRPERAEASYAK